MMLKLRKTVPLGINPAPVWLVSLVGLMGCVLMSVNIYLDDLNHHLLDISFINEAGERVFYEYGYMVPFEYISTGFSIFKPYFVLLAILAAFFIMYHFMGSKSIYTMRRLKNPLELYVRCFMIPCVFILSGIVIIYLLNFLYIKNYTSVVSEKYLYPWWNEGIWRNLL